MIDLEACHIFQSDNGIRYAIRPVQASDAPLIESGFKHLSKKSVIYRFLEMKLHLTKSELSFLTNPDGHIHIAFGAVIENGNKLIPGGIGRYVRTTNDAAELAITIVDTYQKIGLGQNLLRILILQAISQGIEKFYGSISEKNTAMLHLAKKLKFEIMPPEREIIQVTLPFKNCDPQKLETELIHNIAETTDWLAYKQNYEFDLS